MSRINKITAETEKRLQDSLHKIAEYLEDGMHPTDAVYKAAKLEKFLPGHVQLLVNAVNTGQAVKNMQSGGTPLEKAGSFPLACAQTVLDRLFPQSVKTAADIHHSEATSSDYSRSPRLVLRSAAPVVQKVAAASPTVTTQNKSFDEVRAARRAAETAKLESISAFRKAAAALSALGQYFLTPTAVSYPTFAANIKIAYDEAADVCQYLESEISVLRKRAADSHSVNWKVAPYSLFLAVLETSQRATQAQKTAADAEEAAQQAHVAFIEEYAPQTPDSSVVLGSAWEEKQAVSAVGVGVGTTLGNLANSMTNALIAPKAEAVKSQLSQLSDPQHERELQKIQTQAMLADFLRNDPVLGDGAYKPQEVYDAFNQISQLAPLVSRNSSFVRPMLRKYLEQGKVLDPVELQMLTDVEANLRKTQLSKSTEPAKT